MTLASNKSYTDVSTYQEIYARMINILNEQKFHPSKNFIYSNDPLAKFDVDPHGIKDLVRSVYGGFEKIAHPWSEADFVYIQQLWLRNHQKSRDNWNSLNLPSGRSSLLKQHLRCLGECYINCRGREYFAPLGLHFDVRLRDVLIPGYGSVPQTNITVLEYRLIKCGMAAESEFADLMGV